MGPSKPPTPTGYLPGDCILSRDGRTQYQVQKDGSLRKIADQAPGEFKRVLAEQARELIKERGSLVAVPGKDR